MNVINFVWLDTAALAARVLVERARPPFECYRCEGTGRLDGDACGSCYGGGRIDAGEPEGEV